MSKRNQSRRHQRPGQGGNTMEHQVDPREWSPATDVPTRSYAASMRSPAPNSWGGPSWEPRGPGNGREYDDRGQGQRSFGAPSYGTPSYGASSYGAREYGGSEQDGREYGARPYDGPPYGARPYDGRSYDGRPQDTNGNGNGSNGGFRGWPGSSAGTTRPWSGSSQGFQGEGSRSSSNEHEHESDLSCCGPHSGRGPKGYRRSDERIEEDINERLSRHGLVDASDITVSVSDGVVTLSGSVDDRDVKRIAEDIAEDSSGVKQVLNQLRTRSGRSGASRERDDETTTRADQSTRGARTDTRS